MKLDDENWHVLTVSRRDPQTGKYTLEKAPCYHLVGEEEETATQAPPKTKKTAQANKQATASGN
jgi:hypothetical protein